MSEEKIKEIKKALEYAIQIGLDKFSLGASLSDCLTLINELESENNFLRDIIGKFRKETTILYDDICKKLKINTQNA